MIKARWLVAVIGFMLLAVTMHGCALSERTGGNLGLAGYQSVEVEVRVLNGGPYAPDKLATGVQNGIRDLINENYHWSREAKPQARLTVEIVRVNEPSDQEQTILGKPYQIDYLLKAKDADSGAPLGAMTSTTRVAVRSGILPNLLLHGSSGFGQALEERRFESHWSDDTRQKQVLGQLVVDIERCLNTAHHRSPPQSPVAIPVKAIDQNDKRRLASSVPPNRS